MYLIPSQFAENRYHCNRARIQGAPAETIRVDVHLLDRLMNLVGELVLTRNQITQFSARQSKRWRKLGIRGGIITALLVSP
jgi:chemotaxis protein histidine kinase CheA